MLLIFVASNSACVNINGLLTCTCNSGFMEDGLNCLGNKSLCVSSIIILCS